MAIRTVTYGWNTLVPFALTSNTDAASYSVGDTAGAAIVSLALNAPQQSSFVSSPSQATNTRGLQLTRCWPRSRRTCKVRPLKSKQPRTMFTACHLAELPFMQPQSAPTGSFSISDLQAA